MENKYPIGDSYEAVFIPCEENDPRAVGGYTSYDGRSLCHVREDKVPVQQGAIWVKASNGLPDDNIQRIWKWNKSGNPEWKRIELDTSDGIKRWVKADKVDFEDIDLQYLDESSTPSKEGCEDLKTKGNKLALALRRLSRSVSIHPEFNNDSEWSDYIASAEEALKEWEEIPSKESDEWISVKDKLPEKQGRYLIYGRFTRDCPNEVMEADYLFKPRRFMIDGIYSKNVTHWRPLPPPPKQKEVKP